MAAAMNGDADGAATQPTGYSAFCELQAAISADEFARSCRLYLQEHPEYSHSGVWQDFADTYVEYFREHFEAQTSLKHLSNAAHQGTFTAEYGSPSASSSLSKPPPLRPGSSGIESSPRRAPLKCVRSERDRQNWTKGDTTDAMLPFNGTTLYAIDAGDYTGHGLLDAKHNKSFIRRFSFKVLRDGVKPLRHLFKQRSHESHILPTTSPTNCARSYENRNRNVNDKNKFTKIIVECRKEGIVHQLTGEDSNGKSKWEKCRLMLVKTTGGDMLEFYIPPKVRHTLNQ